MEQRERFVRDHRLALYTMAELSARYGISRKTGYKWLDRFDQGGRRRTRRSQPGAAAVSTQNLRRRGDADLRGSSASTRAGGRTSSWIGSGRVIRAIDLPAVRTAGDLLARKGLVKKRRRRRHTASRRGADQDRPPQ